MLIENIQHSVRILISYLDFKLFKDTHITRFLLKVPFRSQINNFHKKYFKELGYIYYDNCF